MKEKISYTFLQVFILVLLFIVLIGFIGMIQEFLISLILAAIFAGLLYPFYKKVLFYSKNKSTLAALSVIFISILAIGLPLLGLIGMITNEAIEISEKASPIVKEMLDDKYIINQKLPDWFPLQEKFNTWSKVVISKTSDATNAIGSWLVSSLSNVTKGTVNFFMNIFIFLYAMFYFLLNGPKLLESLSSLIPLPKKDYDELFDRGLMVTKASLNGILIVGLIQAILVGIAFWFTGIYGPLFLGTLVFLLSAIPGLGAPLIWLPAAIYLIFTGDVGWGIALILWGILVVGLVDNLLRPWIVGREANLPDLIIFISIIGGITSFGPVGIILGPVIVAFLDTILNIYKKSYQKFLS